MILGFETRNAATTGVVRPSGLIQQRTVPGTKMLLLTYIGATSTFYALNEGTLTSTSVTRITSVTKA